MKVLVVGGTGLIGGEIALYLQENGHAVTMMSRQCRGWLICRFSKVTTSMTIFLMAA